MTAVLSFFVCGDPVRVALAVIALGALAGAGLALFTMPEETP